MHTLRLRNIKLKTSDAILKLVKPALRLKKLDLSFNQFKKNQIAQLGLGLSASQTLKHLNLSHNQISNQNEVIATISNLIKYSVSLLDLNLSYTNICNSHHQLELIQALSKSQTI